MKLGSPHLSPRKSSPPTGARLCALVGFAALLVSCSDGSSDDADIVGESPDSSSSSEEGPADGVADREGDREPGTSADGESIEWLDYDASENSYRLKDGGGWLGESEDGCVTDKFTTWPEWNCAPGELSGTIVRFWSDDTISSDDPDYERTGHETIVNLSDGTLEMGIQMLSVDPVVLSSVEFLVQFPAELLEFTSIERHWASIARDEPPSSHVDVEVVEPGVLKFTWWMENLPRVVHKGDIPVASLYFDIIAAGEGEFTYPRPAEETWDGYQPPYKWHLKSEVTDRRAVWATMVDGTEGPVHWLWNSTLVVRP